MDFPTARFDYNTFGYAHDFCNQEVKESKSLIPVIAPVQI